MHTTTQTKNYGNKHKWYMNKRTNSKISNIETRRTTHMQLVRSTKTTTTTLLEMNNILWLGWRWMEGRRINKETLINERFQKKKQTLYIFAPPFTYDGYLRYLKGPKLIKLDVRFVNMSVVESHYDSRKGVMHRTLSTTRRMVPKLLDILYSMSSESVCTDWIPSAIYYCFVIPYL